MELRGILKTGRRNSAARRTASETGFPIDAYVDIMRIGGVETAFAVFLLDEGKNRAPSFLKLVMRKVGSMSDRLSAAEQEVPPDDEWRDFFVQWIRAIREGNRCVRLPASVTFKEKVYIKMISTDNSSHGREAELRRTQIPQDHIVPAIAAYADNFSTLSLQFLA